MATNIQTPIQQATPAEAADEILTELFYTAYRNDGSEWDKRVAAAYQAAFGYEFDAPPQGEGEGRPSFALYGPPGHGKTAAFRSAGKRFASLMGMNYVENPAEDYMPTKEDFLHWSIEMSGEMSNLSTVGLPSKGFVKTSDGVEHAVTEKLIFRPYLQMQEAGAGVLLFDDFNNAAHVVQNQLLSIAQSGRIQTVSFGQCLIGLTGNLGAADNTETFAPKLALKTRCQQMYIEDNVKDFVRRADEKYATSSQGFLRAKDLITSFIASREDLFAGDPSGVRIEQGDVYACPRTWEYLIHVLGPKMRSLESNSQVAALGAQNVAHRVVGGEVAQKFGEYFYQMTTSALPLARELIANGKLSAESQSLLKEKLGNGINAEEADFSQQFAMALANTVGEEIIRANSSLRGEKRSAAIAKLGEAYYAGLHHIEPSHQFLSLARTRTRAETVIGDILDNKGDRLKEVWVSMVQGFKTEMKKRIQAGELHPDDAASFGEQISRVLSKTDAISNKVSLG